MICSSCWTWKSKELKSLAPDCLRRGSRDFMFSIRHESLLDAKKKEGEAAMKAMEEKFGAWSGMTFSLSCV